MRSTGSCDAVAGSIGAYTESVKPCACPMSSAISAGAGTRLRVGPKSSLTQTKPSEHETNRGEAEKSERVSGEIFEILGQAATAIEPREGALDIQASRQKLKPFGVIGAFDDFDFEVRQKFGRSLLKDWPLIFAVSCKNGYKPNKVERTSTPPSRS